MVERKPSCPKCGDAVLDTDATCMNCGASLKVEKRPPGTEMGEPGDATQSTWGRDDVRAITWVTSALLFMLALVFLAVDTSQSPPSDSMILGAILTLVLWGGSVVYGIALEVQQAQERRAGAQAEYLAARAQAPELSRAEWERQKRAEARERMMEQEGALVPGDVTQPNSDACLEWFNRKACEAGVPERFVYGEMQPQADPGGPNIRGAVIGALIAGGPGMIVGGLSKRRQIVSRSDFPIVKECPDCREHVKVRANVCRYCSCRFQGDVDAWLAELDQNE